MEPWRLKELLGKVSAREISTDQALEQLRDLPLADIGSARIDHHRHLRVGVPEVVFAQSKTAAEIAAAVKQIRRHSEACLVTRIQAAKQSEVSRLVDDWRYYERAGAGVSGVMAAPQLPGSVVVVSAGTSDESVVAEAVLTLEFLGVRADVLRDVGVAGLQRVLGVSAELKAASVVIVVAGMDAALASVVAGLVEAPIVAVPTSVGYGASFKGLAALLAMLNSCAPGVSVVNIDNGFGAAIAARQILSLAKRLNPPSKT